MAQVFDEAALNTLRGYLAVGHCRYSTSGASVRENAQPTFRSTMTGGLALGHNGNLINTLELARRWTPMPARCTGCPRRPPTRRADRAVRRPPQRHQGPRRGRSALQGSPAGGDASPHRPRRRHRGDGPGHAPARTGRLLAGLHERADAVRARDPQGFRPLVRGRASRPGGRWPASTRGAGNHSTASVREIEAGRAVDHHR